MLSANIKKDIGTRIKKVRTKSGLTQMKFAEDIDISVNYLSEIENGKKCISVEKLYKFCQNPDLSADYILYGENDNSSENTLDHIIELSQNLSAEEIGSLVDYYSALVNLRRLSEKKKSSADASAKSVKSNNTASHDNLKQCACQE